MKTNHIALISVILFAALYRVMPHPPNVAPVAAMALFAGAHFSHKGLALVVPLVVLLISDIILGFHGTMVYVYGGIMLTTYIGFSLRKATTAGNVVLASLGASAAFFLITNFGAWLGSELYSQDFSGLFQAYLMGVPFMYMSVLGDLFFCVVFFGCYALAKKVPQFAH